MCRHIPTTNAALNNARIEQTAADPSKDTKYTMRERNIQDTPEQKSRVPC
jgi:hypothetical protein